MLELNPGEVESPDELDAVNTPEQVATYIRKSPAALAQMRYLGTGPKFVRIGRSIRYRKEDIASFLDENSHTSTTKAR